MKCVKCGVGQNKINIERASCRIHNISTDGECDKCNGMGNCYHDWTYFYNFWYLVRLFKLFFYRHSTQINRQGEEYVNL